MDRHSGPKKMMRLFMDPLPQDKVELRGKDLQHIKVRRLESGNTIEILDGCGSWLQATLFLDGKRAWVNPKERGTFPSFSAKVDCVLAIPQALDTYFNLLPSLIQIGVGQIGLLQTHWSGSLKKKREKFEQKQQLIAQESLKQSGRGWMPTFHVFKDWPTAIDSMKERQNILLHPGERSLSAFKIENRLCFWIGPEAGFHDDEVAMAQQSAFQICNIGPFIQKMETAAIGSCFWGQNQF